MMKKLITLTTAALIGLSVAGTAPASAHGFTFHGHGFTVGIGIKHRVKVCRFDPFFDEVVCKWRWRRVWY